MKAPWLLPALALTLVAAGPNAQAMPRFVTPAQFPVGSSMALEQGDFDGDGDVDVASANSGFPNDEVSTDPLPIFFEPNRGQARPGVAFLAYAPGYRAFLSPTAVTLGLAPSPREGGAVLRMSLAGADPLAEATASHPLEGRVSHFLGKDPGSWLSGIPTFGRVRFEDVYRGIDLASTAPEGMASSTTSWWSREPIRPS
jgi:hypothetical protein